MARPIPPKQYTDDAGFPSRLELAPIGVVRAPHRERHGTPRQAVLAADPALRPDERARLELFEGLIDPAALDDLAGREDLAAPAVVEVQPRQHPEVVEAGETVERGLFATRAPHRPNPIGLSAVRILGVEGLVIHVERIDLLDGTPILDLKPYVPYADAFPDARAGWLDERGAVPEGEPR